MTIRPAREEDLPALREYTVHRRAWVHADAAGRPVAYLLAEVVDGLRRIRAAEVAHGLDRWPRIAMVRPVARPRGPSG